MLDFGLVGFGLSAFRNWDRELVLTAFPVVRQLPNHSEDIYAMPNPVFDFPALPISEKMVEHWTG
jgi:hypothetical protein